MGEPARALTTPDNVVTGPWTGKLVAPPSLRDRTADVFVHVLPPPSKRRGAG